MTGTTTAGPTSAARSAADGLPGERRRRLTPARIVLQAFLIVTALSWLFPLAWALFNSFRDYNYTSTYGYASLGGYTLANYQNAWESGGFDRTFLNSVLITVPTVFLTLLLASMIAFVLARFSFKLNLTLLGVFLAANLLPPSPC